MDAQILNLIVDSIKDLKETFNNRLDKIENKLDMVVTKEECKDSQDSCLKNATVKEEWSYKKFVVVASILTGFFSIIALIIKVISKIGVG